MKKLFLLLILCSPLAALADAIDGTYVAKTGLAAAVHLGYVINSKNKTISLQSMHEGGMQTHLMGHYRIEGNHLIYRYDLIGKTITLTINSDGSIQENPAHILYKE